MDHNNAISTLDTSILAQESSRAVKKPFTIDVEALDASATIREQLASFLRQHFGPHVTYDAFLNKATASFESLQKALKSTTERLHQVEHAFNVNKQTLLESLNRNTSFIRSLNEEIKEVARLRDYTTHLESVIQRMQAEIDQLKVNLEKAKDDNLEQERLTAAVSKRLIFVAREAMKYRRGNPLHAFPEIQSMLRRLTWEISMVSAKLNAIPGVPGANGLSGETQSAELASAARRSLNLAEDTVQYFHRVEEASWEISGSLGENTVEKEINKAALGSRSQHLLDLVDRFR
ncbi:hypothetical protein AAF712_016697 [Marasmius tenuissimus]|uniref:Uncharacterized protein n=1 Tax=Marasmius tenuissimus TaxID=585030 RepID=A0ABR2Z888_9AGAR